MKQTPSLSNKEALILAMLVGSGELYGLEMVEQSEGKLKRGTVYVTLGRMEDKGFVTSRQEEVTGRPGLPRRLYQITGLGQRVLAAREAVMVRFRLQGAGAVLVGLAFIVFAPVAVGSEIELVPDVIVMLSAVAALVSAVGFLIYWIGAKRSIRRAIREEQRVLLRLSEEQRRQKLRLLTAEALLGIEEEEGSDYLLEMELLDGEVDEGRDKVTVVRPPGTGMRRVVELLFSKKRRTLVFEPLLADLHEEYCEALAKEQPRTAYWIKVRYRFAFAATILAQVPVSLGRVLFALWKAAG